MTLAESSFFVNMEKYSIEEIWIIIENELRAGKTHEEIAELVGKSKDYVQKTKKQLVQKGRITDDEIEQAKFERTKKFMMTDSRMQKIMKYVKAGLSQTDIGELVGCTQTMVRYHIRRFKEYGLITQEEIERARKEYMQEVKYDDFRRDEVLEQLRQGRLKNNFAPELGLTGSGAKVIQKSLIEEGRITQAEIDEAVATKGKESKRKNEAVELLKQGYTYKEVTEAVGYCQITVRKIKEQAISEGKLTEEQYQKARKERRLLLKNEPSKPNEEENKQLEQQVYELLLKGKDMYFMRKKTGETRANIQAVIKKLIEEGKITQSKIDEARDNAGKELEQKVLIGLRRGYSQREIVEMFEEGECTLGHIRACIKRLKERGEITEEQIARYKYEAEQGEKALYEFVLRGVKQGLSRAAMAEMDETGYFTESKIQHAINKMKQQGIITEKDIERGRKVRKQSNEKKMQKNRSKIDKEIVKLLSEGFSAKEIGQRLGYLENTIQHYVYRMRKEGKLPPEEEIKQVRKLRRDAEKQRRKEIEEKEKQEEQEKARKQKKEEDRDSKDYKSKLELALKIQKADDERYTGQKINKLVQELISLAEKMQAKGLLKSEELKIISGALFQAEKIDVNNVLGIARLYLRMKNYQASIYTLNYSKDFLGEYEDLQRVVKAVKTIGIYRRKIEADHMMRQGYSMEIIQQRTQLSLSELLQIKNRNIQSQPKGSNNKNATESQGDDEFPDL